MIAPFLDDHATRAGERYVNFLLSLRSVLNASLKVNVRDARVFNDIRAGAAEVADTFIDGELDHLEGALNNARRIAVERARREMLTGAPAKEVELQDYAEELFRWFEDELRAQVARDTNVLVQKRRELAIAATTNSWGRGRSVDLAFANLIAQGREKVDFYFTDRSGRRYPSQKFYRQLVRHALLTYATETFVLEASSMGAETVFIDHPEKNNSYAGTRLTLVGDPNMLSLADVQDEAFHPNSIAFVTTIDPA